MFLRKSHNEAQMGLLVFFVFVWFEGNLFLNDMTLANLFLSQVKCTQFQVKYLKRLVTCPTNNVKLLKY